MTEVSPQSTKDTKTPEPRPVEVKGRTILVKMPNETQGALIASVTLRVNRLADKLGGNWDMIPGAQMLGAIATILDILQNLCVNPLDEDWLVEEMKAGRLDLADITPLLSVWNDERQPSNRRARRASR